MAENSDIIDLNGQQLMPIIKEESSLEQAPRAMNLDDIFFKDILSAAAGLLKKQMITGHNLKVALLTLLNILSAKLHKPMGIMLAASDLSVGMNILRQCMLIAPEESYREYGQIKNEDLFSGTSGLNGKTLISHEPLAFVKSWGHLEKMLTIGAATHTEAVKAKFGTFTHSYKAEALISIVGIITDIRDRIYNHPAILKLPLHVDEYPLGQLLLQQDNRQPDIQNEVATVRLRETLARLRTSAVEIPFVDKLIEAIRAATPSDPERKIEMILKTLAIVCIINHPEPVSQDEIVARIYKIDIHKLRQMADSSTANQDTLLTRSALTATKIDYFHTWLLMNDMIPVKEIYLSDRQMKIFESVKRINLGKLGNSHTPDNTIKQLSQISTSSSYWAKRESIFEWLNKSGIEEISQSTIYNELQYLMKEGLIAEGKYPKSSQKGYYVTTFQAGQKIQLPHPSEIIDSTFKGEKVQVVNPLTGETETI